MKLNGKAYEIEVEELSAGQTPAPKAAPASQSAPQPAKLHAVKPASSQGGEAVQAPMPGTILDIKVKEGQGVKAGEILCILEAMKMENEIVAPKDGVVVSINTSKGAGVNNGEALVTIA